MTGRQLAMRWGVWALVLLSCLRVAWVCDDAYITFRTIDNWLLGHGPVWNPGERVQAYTHPLWMLLMAGPVALGGEPWLSSMGLGLVLTASCLGMLGRLPGAIRHWPVFLVLAASKAFTEFSTSGLENSLSHAIVAWAGVLVVCGSRGPVGDRWLGLALGLLPLCRPDLVLVAVPVALFVGWDRRSDRPWGLALGLLLPGIWTVFTWVYYGSPVPNTALAKLGQAPLSQLLPQGLAWLWCGLRWDPLSIVVIGLGATRAVHLRRVQPGVTALAMGGLVYLAWVVSIGGDFMFGRFLTVPMVTVMPALLVDGVPTEARPRWVVGLAGLAVVLGLLMPRGPWRTGLDYEALSWDNAGIADERGWYFQHLGLLPRLRRGQDAPRPGRGPQDDDLRVMEAAGLDGYMAGPLVHIVDVYALGDPFLARLPSDEIRGRPGHWRRALPDGYLDTLQTHHNQLTDPALGALWDDVSLATRAPLWSSDRGFAIGRLTRRLWAHSARRDDK